MSSGGGIERVTPTEIRIEARGTARLRIEGRGFGALRVGKQRRWVWGAFDETFSLTLNEHKGEVSVTLRSISGLARRTVPITLCANIAPSEIATAYPAVRSNIHVPVARRIVTARIRAPRLLSLTRPSTSDLSLESDSIA